MMRWLGTVRSRLLATLAVLVLAVTVTATTASATTGPATTGSAATAAPAGVRTFVVGGRVAHRLTLTAQQLRRDYPVRTQFDRFNSDSGTQYHVFRGVLLSDVLATAGPIFDPSVKNDKLRFVIEVTGSDNYAAVVSWGEIDPDFAGVPVLLAFQQDGAALALPRLVVPGDQAGGRYVSDVVSVTVSEVG